ncbi:MAG: NADH:flavin oxidoreductase [Micromonosporaceae bacterium]|nr:NADH:flavin oxidoreductase [Micromonosporaceae bacterium]
MPNPPDVFAPARLGPVRLRNRVIKSATFEGAAPGALVSQRLIDFHTAVGRGGAGMTTVAYLAVAAEGRTERDQIYWRPEALTGLARLTEAVHATGAKVCAQIGHAGPVANARSTGSRSLAPTTRLSPVSLGFDRGASTKDIVRIVEAHAQAAAYARDAGFDAVELHFGHNYLISSFLSPRLNRRKDEWGGSLGNRAEFARRTAAAVRERVGDSIAVLAKVNMHDGVRSGLRPDDSLAFARLLESDGHLDALVLTGGSSLLNPMYLFRGAAPIAAFARTQAPVHRLGVRLLGRLLFREYAYRPLYFLPMARRFRAELSMPLVLLGGITDRSAMDTAMREGFQYVAMARALLREPDLVNRLQSDTGVASLCDHSNLCVPTIYSGTHCPLIPPGSTGRESVTTAGSP